MLPAFWWRRVAAAAFTIMTQVDVATAMCMAASAAGSSAAWPPRAAYSTGTATKPPPKPNNTVVTPLRTPNRARTRYNMPRFLRRMMTGSR